MAARMGHARLTHSWSISGFPARALGLGQEHIPPVCRPCVQLLTANPSLAVTDLPGCLGSAECALDP